MRGRKKKTKSKHKIKREIGEETERIEQELTFQPKSIKMERERKVLERQRESGKGKWRGTGNCRRIVKNSEEQKKGMHA